MSELKPCPFCGSEAELVESDYGDFHTGYAVYCRMCCTKVGVSGRLGETYEWIPIYSTEAEAIEAWNTRVERTCKKLPSLIDQTCIVRRNCQGSIFEMEFGYWRCSECQCENFDGAKRCMECGAKVIE